MKKVQLSNHCGKFNPFSAINKIMFICGLDITSFEKIQNVKATRLKLMYQKLASVFWVIYIIYIIGSIITADILTTTLQSVNGKIARRSVDISAFLIWSVMTIRKKQISHLLHDVENLRNIKDTQIPKLWIITGVIVIIVVPFAAWMSITIPFHVEFECKILVKHHSFGFDLVKKGNNCSALLILIFFRQFFVYTLRTAVSVLYVIICCSLRNALNTNSELGAKVVADPNAKVDYAI
ncbi:uncharacterized protein NPIL_426591 [Nephila pilipes]|uniref:Uncharacterized protein n=1 Tax=Nephila pilipes TaxID=299642 RepID=A0A8X6TLR9_NEPPI|nr:uncharacterized protein NPIL_426591 [Nephila pilipes]